MYNGTASDMMAAIQMYGVGSLSVAEGIHLGQMSHVYQTALAGAKLRGEMAERNSGDMSHDQKLLLLEEVE